MGYFFLGTGFPGMHGEGVLSSWHTFVAQQKLNLMYKNEKLQLIYKPYLIYYGQVIVEFKAVKDIVQIHKVQVINDLKVSKRKLGLLMNFGTYPKASIVRLAYKLPYVFCAFRAFRAFCG